MVLAYYFQATLTKPYHRITSNVMFVFRRLHLNFSKVVTLFTLNVVIGDNSTRL